MNLRERWVEYLYRAATGTQKYRSSRTPFGLAIFGLFTALFVVLSMFGLGFAMHSLSLVLVFTPLYVLSHVWELKQIEEPELIKRFGEEFLAYREHTPMFVPRLRDKPGPKF